MKFDYRFGFDGQWIDSIIALHNRTDLQRPLEMKDRLIRAYSSRFAVVTCWVGSELIGFGTMISDGEMYSSIFDVVVDPIYQGKGIGREIMKKLMSKAPNTFFHLTSTFGNEQFYQKVGFKRHKTAFAKYPVESNYLED